MDSAAANPSLLLARAVRHDRHPQPRLHQPSSWVWPALVRRGAPGGGRKSLRSPHSDFERGGAYEVHDLPWSMPLLLGSTFAARCGTVAGRRELSPSRFIFDYECLAPRSSVLFCTTRSRPSPSCSSRWQSSSRWPFSSRNAGFPFRLSSGSCECSRKNRFGANRVLSALPSSGLMLNEIDRG
jgi:hypothetical protein